MMQPKKEESAAHKAARIKYDKKAYRQFIVKINRYTHPAAVERLEKQTSIIGYIVQLIERDIKENP